MKPMCGPLIHTSFLARALASCFFVFLVESIAWAADPTFPRGPGMYFSLFKLVPLVGG